MRLLPLLILAALVGPWGSAAAAAGSLQLASGEPASLEGELRVEAPNARAIYYGTGAEGDQSLVGVTGLLRVWTWQVNRVDAAGLRVSPPREPPTETRYLLQNATIVHEVREGYVRGAVQPNGTLQVSVAGAIRESGGPLRLQAPLTSNSLPLRSPMSAPWQAPDLEIEWDAGWYFAGRHETDPPVVGFPMPASPRLTLGGELDLLLEGGNLTFVDAKGAQQRVRLGNWTEGTGLAPTRHVARAILTGRVDEATIALPGSWGVGAPALAWALDGSATWAEATGAWRDAEGSTRAFEGARVAAQGRFLIDATAPGIAADRRYAAAGEFDAVRIDGAAVVASTERAGVLVGASIAALLLGFLFDGPRAALARSAALLYSRLAPADLLQNKRRRQIYDTIRAEPGMHLRELHRRAAVGYGALRFHLRLLESAGYVREERVGRYALLYARGASSAPALPHPVTREVYAAIPLVGVISFAQLRRATGLSRQLLTYHVQGLERRGLVEVAVRPDRMRELRRAPPANPLAAPFESGLRGGESSSLR